MIGTARPEGGKARKRVLRRRAFEDLARLPGRRLRPHRWLFVLDACRRQEVGGMAWSEIDLTAAPGRSQATGPRTATTIRCRCRRWRWRSSERCRTWSAAIFVRLSRPAGFCRWGAGKAALDQRAGVADWKLHDIRRSVATRMADLGVQPHIIERCYSSQRPQGRRRRLYNRSIYYEARCAPRWRCGRITSPPW